MTRAGLALLGGLALTGCFDTSDTPLETEDAGGCPIGSETCPCTQAGTCDPGLQCLSELCVASEGPTSTDGSTSGVADDTTTTPATDDTTTADDTTTGDPCGGQCSDEEACIDGRCVPACAAGELLCSGTCIDPLSDMDHCGAAADCLGDDAGVACDPTPLGPCPGALGEACVAGQCAPACPSYEQSFGVTGAIEDLVLPMCVTQIHVVATGAQGGSSSSGSDVSIAADSPRCSVAAARVPPSLSVRKSAACKACDGRASTRRSLRFSS